MTAGNGGGGTRNRLVMFVKEPTAGNIKTRLAKDIGTISALWWYRHNVVRTVRRLASDPRWEFVLAVTPDALGLESHTWPSGIRRIPQGPGDLGRRLEQVNRQVGRGALLVIGSDIPNLRVGDIAHGFKLVSSARFALGPSPDGGYWAIGWCVAARKWPNGVLRGVRWSSEHACADTTRVMSFLGRPALLATKADVDTANDLRVRAG